LHAYHFVNIPYIIIVCAKVSLYEYCYFETILRLKRGFRLSIDI